MRKDLFNMFLEIEYALDEDISGYFNLTEQEKENITFVCLDFLIRFLDKHPTKIHIVLFSLGNMIQESVAAEDYEKADIYKRIKDSLTKLTFF